jgi:hypothetical protein
VSLLYLRDNVLQYAVTAVSRSYKIICGSRKSLKIVPFIIAVWNVNFMLDTVMNAISLI